MLFGNKNTFAIEAMCEENLEPPSLVFGRLCLWCQNVPLGDIHEENCGLEAFDSLSDLIEVIDDLWIEEFEGMSDQDLTNHLDFRLYGYHGKEAIEDDRTLEDLRRDAIKYQKFDFLTNWGEMFDRGGKSFILHHPAGTIKILNVKHFSENGRALVTSTEAFVSAIKESLTWYRQMQDNLRSAHTKDPAK